MTYDYDRQKTAAQGHQNFIALELENPINDALSEFGTGLEGRESLKVTGNNTFEIAGKTRDNRDWSGTGEIYLSERFIQVVADVKRMLQKGKVS